MARAEHKPIAIALVPQKYGDNVVALTEIDCIVPFVVDRAPSRRRLLNVWVSLIAGHPYVQSRARATEAVPALHATRA